MELHSNSSTGNVLKNCETNRIQKFASSLSNNVQHQDADSNVTDSNKLLNHDTGYSDNLIGDTKKLSSSLLNDYLQKGDYCSSLGYQKQAMAIYQKGLDNTDYKHRQIFRQRYKMAQDKSELRIDIPGLLPYEITTSIAEYLIGESCLVLLDVSKAWRYMFSQCPSVWSTIVIQEHYNDYTVGDIMKLGFYVGPQVLDFTLYSRFDERYTAALLHGMINGRYSSIRHLALFYCPLNKSSELLSALREVSKTLTQLDIMLDVSTTSMGENASLPYKTILATCHNLESFKYDHLVSDFSKANNGSLGQVCISKLETLHLGSFCIELENLEDILQSSPSLRNLELNGCGSEVLDVALFHCKMLEIITLLGYTPYIDYSWVSDSQSPKQYETGVRTLTATIDNIEDFTGLFALHCHTIEVLSLYMTAPPPLHQWMSLMNTFRELSSLTYLILHCTDNAACTAAATLIQKSPALLSLQFNTAIKVTEQDLARAIVAVPRLQILHFTNAKFPGLNLQILFQGLAAKNTRHSTLQHLSLSFIEWDDTHLTAVSVFDCLSNIASLQTIEIVQCRAITESMINRFCQKMQQHPSIEAITFDSLDCFTDESLKYLAAIKRLEFLKLFSVKTITDQGLEVFNETTIELVVRACPGTSDR